MNNIFSKRKHNGKLKGSFRWIIPFIIGVSKNRINNGVSIYTLNITPFISISFSFLGTLNGCKIE